MLLLITAGCGSPPTSRYPYAQEPDPRHSEYVIGRSDELLVRVWKNPDLNTDIAVRPDGSITMPLIGDILAAGLTPSQVRQTIEQRMAAFVKEEAVVTVAVAKVNSYAFNVAGNVTKPGRYSASSYVTVADAIALAGGPTRFASADETTVLRSGLDGTVRRIPVNYEAIRDGKLLEQNLVVLRDDTIVVP